MEKNISVEAVNDTECTIFVKHIVLVQKSSDGRGAFIYTNSDKPMIKTKESYETVIQLIKES